MAIRRHRHLYMFAAGEMWLYAGYEGSLPSGITLFSQEPLFWKKLPLKHYEEPQVPAEDEACYFYAPSPSVVVVPYIGSTDDGFNPIIGNRPYRVAYYSRFHGRGVPLRKRLYELCNMAPGGNKPWMCWQSFLNSTSTAKCADGDTQCKARPMFERFQQSDFCFCPVGDGPLRTTVWQALRRGCIPVLFASCPQGAGSSLTHKFDTSPIPRPGSNLPCDIAPRRPRRSV